MKFDHFGIIHGELVIVAGKWVFSAKIFSLFTYAELLTVSAKSRPFYIETMKVTLNLLYVTIF